MYPGKSRISAEVVKGRFTVAGQEYRLHHVDIRGVRPLEDENFDEVLGRLVAPRDDTSLYECAATVAADLGFESFSYGCLYPRLDGPPVLHVCTPLPFEAWLEYHECGLMERDESIHHCRHSIVPTLWTMDNSAIRRHNAELAERWWKARLIFPVHGTHGEVAMLAFNSNSPRSTVGLGKRLNEALAKGQLLAVNVHSQVCQLTGLATEGIPSTEPLTERERAVLALVAKGHQNDIIGTLLGISPRTVKFHIGNVLQKLGCAKRADAVAKGIELGIVHPSSLSGPIRTTSPALQTPTVPRKTTGRCYKEFPEFPILPFDSAAHGFPVDVSSKDDPVQCPAFETADGAYRLYCNWPAPEEREWYPPMTRFFIMRTGNNSPPGDMVEVFKCEAVGELLLHLRASPYGPSS